MRRVPSVGGAAGAAERLAMAQGVFYGATGVWPIAHMPSFEAVTGPKKEDWLVKTVGGLIAVVGGAVAAAGARRRVTPEIAGLAAASALFLAGIDVVYVARGRIRPIYLLDAAVEVAIAGAWAVAARGIDSDV